MVNPKDETKKLKEEAENILDQQKQQTANTTSTILETTNRINNNITD